jgi:beta-phosphoglucomutase-like phosphatase (HAD superfamily)
MLIWGPASIVDQSRWSRRLIPATELARRYNRVPHYTIVGAGDTDHPKPAPALCQETCRRLNVPPSRVVVLEDSIIGVQATRAAGTTVFAIPNLPQTRPIAHRSFPTLADPELWGVLGLTAALATATVPRQ